MADDIGTKGFVTWFEIEIYEKVRKTCKNLYIRLLVHSLGLIAMIIGLYFLLTNNPSLKSILGLFLIIFGSVIFITPFGVDK